MAVILNASTSSGLVTTADNSGQISLQTNGTTAVQIDTSSNLQFNSGYGSVATAYGCRAWVNFNGTGVVAIRASGNVTSITDNGTGEYTVNFTSAMPDVNYANVFGTTSDYVDGAYVSNMGVKASNGAVLAGSKTTTALKVLTKNQSWALVDGTDLNVAIFR